MSNPSNLPDRLFVYGTLLTVAEHPMGALLRDKARFLAHGAIQARLYIIDDPDDPGANFYPGALPSPDPADRVHGEVYSLTDPAHLIEAFNDYEACSPNWPEPHEFLLRNLPVQTDQGLIQAATYLYTWDVTGARHIPSGRFTELSPDTR